MDQNLESGKIKANDDYIEAVYYGNSYNDKHIIEFHDKKIDLNLIKSQKRDAKGAKIR